MPRPPTSDSHDTTTARRDAALLISGSALQWLAFRVAQVALPLVVLAETGSVALMGLVAGVEGLPVLLSPWWARGLRQRVTTGRALAAVAALDAVALAVVPTGVVLGVLSAPVLVAAGLLLGIGEALGDPGRTALIADAGDRIGPDRALTLVTLQDVLRRCGMVAGPALGGLAVASGLTVELLYAQAAAFAVSGVLALPVGRPDRGSRAVDAADPDERLDGAPTIRTALAGRPDVRLGWLLRGTNSLTWFAFVLGLAVLGADEGRGASLLAAGMTGYGVGSLVGSALAPAVVRRFATVPVARAAWTATGALWIVMATTSSAALIGVVAAVGAACTVVGITAVSAMILRSSSGAERRTLLAGQSVVVTATSAAGMMVGGGVIGLVGVRPTLAGAGVLGIAVAVTAGRRRLGAWPSRASRTSASTSSTPTA